MHSLFIRIIPRQGNVTLELVKNIKGQLKIYSFSLPFSELNENQDIGYIEVKINILNLLLISLFEEYYFSTTVK